MTNLEITKDHTYQKFLLYLYLTAAYSDFKLSDEEFYIMKEKLARINLIESDNFDKYYKQVLMEFRSNNDYQSQEYILRECSRLKLDKDTRMKIYNDIKDIINADGVVDNSETMELFRIKHLLDLHL